MLNAAAGFVVGAKENGSRATLSNRSPGADCCKNGINYAFGPLRFGALFFDAGRSDGGTQSRGDCHQAAQPVVSIWALQGN